MNKYISFFKTCFAPLFIFLLAMTMVFAGCSDDDDELQQTAFGYVQFKIYKSASAAIKGTETRGTDMLDKLNDAKKIKVVMLYDGNTIEQTLMLNSYSAENAEFGLRSDKLELLAGNYKLIGYYLYDKLDNEIYAGTPNNYKFNVMAGGLKVQELFADAVARGLVNFKLIKHGLPETEAASRAAEGYEDYPFSNIKGINITVKNLFTQELTTIEKVEVKYVENLKDGYALCDTTVWLKTGSYQISSYSTYSDKKCDSGKLLEIATVPTSETFFVKDNEESEATVPIQLSATAEYLKDYMALKEIWEKLNGPNWKYYGEAAPMGCNWNFDKEIDMWGDQPGVQLLDNGRVASLVISGFGADGVVPDAIGQLTELRILNLGAHDELIGGHLFEGVGTTMTPEQRQRIRMDYEQKFLYRDIRENLSQILIDGINANPDFKPIKKSNRIDKKDVQFGNLTNNIKGISKALMRCTKLENFFIANSPIVADNFCMKLVDDSESAYRKAYEEEENDWNWNNFTMLTDMEIYNCKELTSLPMNMLFELPELQMLNVACNQKIKGDVLLDNWKKFIEGKSGKKIQVLYLGYNNLEEMPDYEHLSQMEKLGLIDLTNNSITEVNAFGKEINLTKVYLDYNQINKINTTEDGYFCGYYDMESFTCTYNKLTKMPDIFNAKSKYVIGSVSFAHNEITGMQNDDNHRGVNTNNLDLSYNHLEEFPGVIIKKGSPLGILILQANGMTTIKEGDLVGPNSHLLTSLDFQFNKLKEIPFEDFVPENMPYIYGIEFSYNRFAEFPVAPLNCKGLTVFGIRHQRDESGNRCLSQWPTGLYTCPSLMAFFIGSNDLRKIEDTISPYIRIFEINDNPNISIDLTQVCPYIQAGQYQLIYDKTQNIQGCDYLLD